MLGQFSVVFGVFKSFPSFFLRVSGQRVRYKGESLREAGFQY